VGVVACTGLVQTLRTTGLRHGDIPPVAACAGSWDSVSVDYDDRGRIAAAGVDNHRLELGNVGGLFGMRAHGGRVGDEVDFRLHLDVAVFVHVVELGPAAFDLQPVDAAVAPIVS
jgi:hypothetical protein